MNDPQPTLEQYRAILANLPVVYFQYRLHPDGTDSVSHLGGDPMGTWELSPEEVAQGPEVLWSAILPEDLDSMQASVAQSAEQLTHWNHQYRIRTNKTGTVKWLQGSGNPRRLADGTVVWNTVVMDITEDKKRQEELKHKTLLLEQAESAASLGSWEWYPDTDTVHWSKELFDMLGLPVSEKAPSLEEQKEHMEPQSYQLMKDCALRAVETGESYNIELSYYHADGSKTYCKARGFAQKNEQGKVSKVYGSFQNITEERRREETIGTLRDQLDLAIATAGMGVWQLDVASQKVVCNPEQLKLYGITQEEFDTDVSLLRSMIHPDDEPRASKALDAAFLGKPVSNVEFRVIRKTGETLHVLAAATPVKVGDVLKQVIGVNLNITTQKLAQEQLARTNEDLVAANAELDRFVYSVTHDLRSPIHTVLGLLGLVAESESLEETQMYGAKAVKTLKKLSEFIGATLDQAREGRREVHLEQVPVDKLVAEVLGMNQSYAERMGVELRVEVGNVRTLYTDLLKLEVAINNLVSNAIKFSSQHRQEAQVKVSLQRTEEGEVQIELEDNGPGIAKDRMEKVFEMFYRATDKAMGTGLGLYIAKQNVEMLGGTLEVESVLGQGTCFRIVLPG